METVLPARLSPRKTLKLIELGQCVDPIGAGSATLG